MHFHFVDAYVDAGSRVHRMDPRLKLVCAVALIILIGLTPFGSFGAYLGFFSLVMVLAIIAQLDPWRILKRSFIAVPFALAAVTLIFTIPGRQVWAVPVAGWAITEEGVIRFASIMFKSLVSVQVGVLLMLTTHLTDMLWALSELHVPRVLVAVISFMYRYIFLMADEAVRLTRARDSRSAVMGGNPASISILLFRARTTGRMIGNLFLRSFERSERVYQAMVSRGYQGVMKQLTAPPLRLPEIMAVGLVILVGGAITASSLVF